VVGKIYRLRIDKEEGIAENYKKKDKENGVYIWRI